MVAVALPLPTLGSAGVKLGRTGGTDSPATRLHTGDGQTDRQTKGSWNLLHPQSSQHFLGCFCQSRTPDRQSDWNVRVARSSAKISGPERSPAPWGPSQDLLYSRWACFKRWLSPKEQSGGPGLLRSSAALSIGGLVPLWLWCLKRLAAQRCCSPYLLRMAGTSEILYL